MGGIFPAMVYAHSTEWNHAGKVIGRLYFANTAGAILGSFLSGFVLLPAIGIQNVVLIAIFVYLLLGIFTAWLGFEGQSSRIQQDSPASIRREGVV